MQTSQIANQLHEFVQSFADDLNAQIEPLLCEVEIEFGHNFVAKIEEGLREADLTGTVLVSLSDGSLPGRTRNRQQ